MIVKRNRPPKLSNVRKIVRRNRPEVGAVIGRTIVKRNPGGVIGGPPRGPRGPRFRMPRFSWRPSRGLFWAGGGLATLVLISNGFNLLGVDPVYQRIVTGTIILVAVLLDVWTRRQRR